MQMTGYFSDYYNYSPTRLLTVCFVNIIVMGGICIAHLNQRLIG